QPVAGLLQYSGIEGRVEKHDIEGLRRALQEALRILDHDGGVAAAKPFERLRKMTADLRLAIDERHVRGTARQRLEAERAAAREQIETTRTDDRLLQPVEKCLAYAVRRRTDGGERREDDARAAPAAADDAQAVRRCAFFPGWRRHECRG